MSEDITELSRRISAAFDRMDQGLEALSRKAIVAPAPPAEGEGSTALLRALELARASGDEWAERYRVLQAQMGDETLSMAAEITRLTAELAAARAAPAALEPAASTSTAKPDTDEIDALIARIAQQEAELETLRAARAEDATELAAIIASLDPLVHEAPYV